MSDEFRTEFLEQVDVDDEQATSDDASGLFEDDNTEQADDSTDTEGKRETDPDKVSDESGPASSTEAESGGAGSSIADTNQQSPEGTNHSPDDEPVHDDEDIEKLLESNSEGGDAEEKEEFDDTDDDNGDDEIDPANFM
jgi:hypothetical protein